MMVPQSVAELTRLHASGTRLKFLFFWGHQPQRDGSIGAGCLSQWWRAPFNVDGRTFVTAEHWMMWSKATLFGDNDIAAKILMAGHPSQAKALGRQVKQFDQTVWDQERFGIVVAGGIAKFSQNPDLKTFLLSTKKRVLVEASPVDRIWGIGLAADDPKAEHPGQWRGLNLLGFALMQTREHLQAV